MNIMEKQINWTEFLNGCLSEGDELVRAYWYQAEKLNHPQITFERAKTIAVKQNQGASHSFIEAEAKKLMSQAQLWLREHNEKYDRQLHRYDEMSIQFPQIEMVRKGLIKVDPFKEIYRGEKGLDVALAVNMIKLHSKCEKIILISGDLDYAEAIQYIKDSLKTVHIVRIFKGEPPRNKSVSRMLMAIAEKTISIYETDIRKKYLR